MKRKKKKSIKKKSNTNILDKKDWYFVLSLIGIVFLLYIPSLSNDFVNWDDPQYILENDLIKGSIFRNISNYGEYVAGNFHPLTIFSYSVDYNLFGENPFFYHLKNLFWHLLNCSLVYLLIFKISNGNRFVSFLTALYFGLHPMHVESVAWISERKDVLYSFYFLLGVLLYYRYRATRKMYFLLFTALAFLLALLSKSAAVVFPVVLILLDYYESNHIKIKEVLEKIPFFILSIIFGVVALGSQGGALAKGEGLPITERFLFGAYGFCDYIIKFFYPYDLSSIHPYFKMNTLFGISCLLLVFGIMVHAWIYRKRFRWYFFGLTFYVINIALVLQIIQFGNSVISERYSYMPYIGLGFIYFTFLYQIINKHKKFTYFVYGLLTIQLLFFSYKSIGQIKVWKDSNTLWTNAINIYPSSAFIAYNNRASYFAHNEQFEDAILDYDKCLEIRPNYDLALKGRATINSKLQNYSIAIQDYNNYLIQHPNDNEQLQSRAFSYFQNNQLNKAIEDYTTCIQQIPDNGSLYESRGFTYYKMGQRQNALSDFIKAKELGIDISPNLIEGLR